MRQQISLVLAMVAGALVLGCNDSSGPGNRAGLRVVHAMTDVQTIDARVHGTVLHSALAYKASPQYGTVVTGAGTVEIRAGGAATNLVTADVPFERGTDYTVVAYGRQEQPRVLVLTDAAARPDAGKGKVRIAHSAAVAGNVDVYVLQSATDLMASTAVASDVARGTASSYVTVDVGTWVVIITTAGTRTPLLSTSVTLGTGGVSTVVVIEKQGGGTPLEAVVLAER